MYFIWNVGFIGHVICIQNCMEGNDTRDGKISVLQKSDNKYWEPSKKQVSVNTLEMWCLTRQMEY